jgi:hypothetical protein
MIKLFRKIRYDLMEKNKTGKYLKYALGEIVLVVIGVLIALQINNWDNENSYKEKEIALLSEMVRNLKLNVDQFSTEIEKQDSIIRNIDVFMNQIKNNTPYHDSLGYKYASVAWSEEFNYADSAFETIKTTWLDLISSDALRENSINLFNLRSRR